MENKIGMTHVFDDMGALIPVTVLHIEPNVVVSERDEEKDGYKSKILGVFKNKPQRFTKPQLGVFKDSIEARKKLFEVRGFEDVEIGTELGVDSFQEIDFVDVTGTSKGKGFQGVMKRHNASGGPAAHGSKFHRTGGSTGHSSNPSRVRKGTKMAGRMGNKKLTVQNLEVIERNAEKNILVVKGAVPGAIGGHVLVKEAIKK